MTARMALLAGLLATALGVAQAPAPSSGLDLAGFDRSVRPQDDLFRFANGRWLATADIPPDRTTYGTFAELADRVEADMRAIVEDLTRAPRRRPGSPEQLIADLYTSVIDEARVDALGATPIRATLTRLESARTMRDLATEAGVLTATAGGGPFAVTLGVSTTDATRVIAQVAQGGILLPNRDYYLVNDPAFIAARTKYESYISRILTLIGRTDAAAAARAVVAFETELARMQLPPVESTRSASAATVNTLAELSASMPEFDWRAWAKPQGLDLAWGLSLQQSSFFRSFAKLAASTPIDTMSTWLTVRHITAMAPYLSRPFIDARFEFFGTDLTGQTLPRARWKVGVGLVSGNLTDAIARLYVERHFPPPAQARARRIVANVIKAYREAIEDADWLSRSTKSQALAKLTNLSLRIGFPTSWRDYAGLQISPTDLFGNVMRARRFDGDFRLSRVGGGARDGEWLVSPLSVNAFYSQGMNAIFVPAAFLQPPLFDMAADEAVNYGAFGATIGHEITHGFDDRGRRYDAGAIARDWWTTDEEREFARRASGLVTQFDAFSPIEGSRVNGTLTRTENIGDMVGLSVAHRAYRLSLGGKPAPEIDGFTGDQRFFLGYARMWRIKVREDYLRQWLLAFPHAPYEYRTNGQVTNHAAFYEAFGVTPGDKLFRAPAERNKIW